MKFRKKPVVIEAFQFNPELCGDVLKVEAKNSVFHYPVEIDSDGQKTLRINTLEGTMTAIPGDWIIVGVNGEHYPCKPNIFEKTYELV